MPEFVRVPVSDTHAVDVPVPQSLINDDPTRENIAPYVAAFDTSALPRVPLEVVAPTPDAEATP